MMLARISVLVGQFFVAGLAPVTSATIGRVVFVIAEAAASAVRAVTQVAVHLPSLVLAGSAAFAEIQRIAA
jgi:hypothetical protein